MCGACMLLKEAKNILKKAGYKLNENSNVKVNTTSIDDFILKLQKSRGKLVELAYDIKDFCDGKYDLTSISIGKADRGYNYVIYVMVDTGKYEKNFVFNIDYEDKIWIDDDYNSYSCTRENYLQKFEEILNRK
jgi:hypothetical protein